jgi:hypothetical protein
MVTGILIIAMSVPTVILAPLSGRLVAARGGRRPTTLGVGSAVVGTGTPSAASAAHLSVTLAGLVAMGTAGSSMEPTRRP